MAAALAGALVAIAAAAPAQAATTVLSFNNAKCTPEPTCRSSLTIDQSYGDGVGVDVSYRVFNPLDGLTYRNGVTYWETGYGDLNGVIYGGDNRPYAVEIIFKALAGYELSLSSFDLATYGRISPTTPVSVETLSGASILSGPQSTNPGSHNHVTVNSDYVTDGIRLTFGPDMFNVGMDNIAFDVRGVATGAVPEPATWAMLILGFFGSGALLRRRGVALA
jgi:hypothetical protein